MQLQPQLPSEIKTSEELSFISTFGTQLILRLLPESQNLHVVSTTYK